MTNRTTCVSMIGAGVHCCVVFKFGIELYLQLLQILFFKSSFHIFSELDLLCQTQNLQENNKVWALKSNQEIA